LRLQQLLLNVLENALRVSPPGGAVAVTLTTQGGGTSVAISDQGPGVGPDELGRIFDRLYSRARREGEPGGSGLGLAIARAIAEDHGGELRVENNPAGGATFTLTLPLGGAPASTPGDERGLSLPSSTA
ncbi:MAG: hypothetical protein QOG59_3344, partial [Solirubrobacteraceae bacterium]|nr:hypothetical protein [Solirubrobacteraceae bacterium]